GLANGPAALRPGAPALDAPLPRNEGGGYLLDRLDKFVLLSVGESVAAGAAPSSMPIPGVEQLTLASPDVVRRYGAGAGQAHYLIRPDQHIAARWSHAAPLDLTTTCERARGRSI
ncbi:MAG TPA: FAD-dependent oxidoreductase, partial [Hyphomicrobiaceae bacterium]|nr:FAD-dependent oxidoreductase [Hyphomicrobiaceae bacterium]